MNELNEREVDILQDMFAEMWDKLRHYDDGDMGWNQEDKDVFWGMNDKLYKRARELDVWWAK